MTVALWLVAIAALAAVCAGLTKLIFVMLWED